MRRLTKRLRRLNRRRERGAVAVMVALLMVVLLGATAIGVDVAAISAEKQELQNGADAGALAIAQSCADGNGGATGATAQNYAEDNKKDSDATGTVVDLNTSVGEVTVQTETLRDNWFAGFLGFDQTTIQARATAIWGPMVGGRTMPLIFSVCEWWTQLGFDEEDPNFAGAASGTIYLSKSSDAEECERPNSGNYVPGGFGYIDTEGPHSCTAVTYIEGEAEWVDSSPGNTPPSGCDDQLFKDLVDDNTEFLIPLFDEYEEQGANARYRLYAYAAFEMEGFNFGGQYKYGSPVPCKGNERCIQGTFVEVVAINDANTCWPGCPDGLGTDNNLGVTVVRLVA